jgi:ABC-2 type transport system ATP-binding protein
MSSATPLAPLGSTPGDTNGLSIPNEIAASNGTTSPTPAGRSAPPPAIRAAPTPLAIDVRGVRRVYKTKPNPVVALDGIDLQVEPGEFFGLLGPNGAGKTTLIKILTTLLLPSEGTASVFGFDVSTHTKQLRRIMNMVAGGEQSGYGMLSVKEQLWMFSQFYGLGVREGQRRVDELIEAVGLEEQRSQRVGTLSTGQRQKMNFARGLLNDPWIFFLDEPTLGLDVSAARAVRELVVAWKAAVPGRTVLLTTHYMAEADELCERLAIVDRGRILAIGTPDELKRRVQRESIFRLELDRLSGGVATLARLPGVVSAVVATDATEAAAGAAQTVTVNLVLVQDAALGGIVGALGGIGSQIVSLRKSEPSLEDVFVELVGRGFHEDGRTTGPAGTTARGDERPSRLAAGDADPRPTDAARETNEPDGEEVAR